ncbi:hypothetical protein EB796_016193 [Bugula neritina]|uniref:CHCHD3 n=1 Tax=Bugula neritina TaxID=10212 RepID=A0A7J7JIN9_BUGNE|nr:hypothetical protein EB796_016193 [Bugula neritina]
MGASQSSETRSVTLKNENPNEIAISQSVLCSSVPEPEEDANEQSSTKKKRVYSEEETANLTAKLDKEYAAWITDVERKNESVTKQLRDELVQKADALYERFAYVEGKPICEEAKKAVLECYESNVTTPLNCSEEVKYFTNCVKNYQINYDKRQHLPKPVKTK